MNSVKLFVGRLVVSFLLFSGLLPLSAQGAEGQGAGLGDWTGGFSWSKLSQYLDVSIAGLFTLGDLLLCFLIIFAVLLFRRIIIKVVFAQLKKWAEKTATSYDDEIIVSLEKPASLFLLLLGVYLGIGVLPLAPEVELFTQRLFRGLSMLIMVWATMRLIDVVAEVFGAIAHSRGMTVLGFIPLIKKSLRITIFVVGAVMVIDNLGYSIAGILTTLGLGGAALAFAAKDTVANIYGSMALALDRPFKVGDWIIVGNKVDGDVESIGLRSTRVRTWPKTVLSIPNMVLANEMVDNWGEMPKRRVKQVIGVTYESSAEDMDGLVEDIRQLLREDEGVDQEFMLVNFTDFGESSLDVLVYYFTKSIKWLEHMDVRQRVNTKIMRAIKARGLMFAFPSRALYLKEDVPKQWAERSRRGEFDGRLPGDSGLDMPQ